MKRKSLKVKIIVPAVVILALLIFLSMAYFAIKSSDYSHNLLDEKISITASILENYLKDCESRSKAASVSQSKNENVVKAVRERDTKELINILLPTLELYNIDYYTITDETGIVLARTHEPSNYGDSVLNQQNVLNALYGEVSTYYEEGTVVKVSTRTGSPIYNAENMIIGVVSAGVRLDTNEAVEKLKHYFSADFTVYFGDTRIATTIVSGEERIINTKLNAAIAKIVIDDQNTHFGNVDIVGENFSMYYLPLINSHDEVFAIFSAGYSNTDYIARESAFITSGILIGLAGLVISIVVILFIVGRVTKPIKHLMRLVSEVTKGNIHVETDKIDITNDEVGDLMLDIYSFVDMTKSVVNDLLQLIDGLHIRGETSYRIDTDKYCGSYKDIVENIQTLADLIPAMNKLMTVMDNLDSMINVVDLDYNIVYINRSLADTYGVDKDQCVGEKCYSALKRSDQPCSMCQLPKLLPDKESFPCLDYEFLYDVYIDKWLGGRASIIRWIDGSMVYFQSLNDETEKKIQQEQLLEAMEDAQKANQLKGEFLANVSHEIRTPMNTILGMTELLLHENLSERQVRYAEDMKTSAMMLLSIINDILDVSKLQAGKLALVPVHYNFASLVDNISSMAHFLADEKRISYQLIMQEENVYLFGDDLRLRQVLINLINNAIKFTEKGFVQLEIGMTDDSIKISVRDTGIGIQAESIPTLFNAFEQADERKNKNINGTGLGLTITKAIVDMMGGHITVESVYGQGSTFHVEIPKVLGDKSLIYRTDDSEAVICAPDAQVLVVDDLLSNLNVATGLLGMYQVDADIAVSGKQAIDMIQKKQYDLVFMDHRMPELSGTETTRILRKMGILVPIIALTASVVIGAKETMLTAGMNDYLWKPIVKGELATILQKWLPVEKLCTLPGKVSIPSQANDEEHAKFWSKIKQVEGLSVVLGLKRAGNQHDVYEKTLRLVVQEIEKSDGKLNAFLATGDLENFRVLVHGIKSSLANIGAMELSEMAHKLEKASAKEDLNFCASNLPRLLARLNALALRLKEILIQVTHDDASLIIPSELPPIFERLHAALSEMDMMAIEKEVGGLDTSLLSGELKAVIERIKDLVMIMDYDGADEQVRKLLYV